MISPANTYVGLTHSGPGTAAGEPDKYYPTGKRNYIRIVAADDFQGAADALLTQQLGLKNDLHPQRQGGVRPRRRDRLSRTRAESARRASRSQASPPGTARRRRTPASPRRSSSPGADAVFLGGLVCENGGKLIKDLRSVLGNDVTLMSPDGFTPISAVVDGAGDASEGHVRLRRRPAERERSARPARSSSRTSAQRRSAARTRIRTRPMRRSRRRCSLTAIEKSDGTRADGRGEPAQHEGDRRDPRLVHDQLGRRHELEPGHRSTRSRAASRPTYKTITPPQDLVKGA